jgi:hypothetical protein
MGALDLQTHSFAPGLSDFAGTGTLGIPDKLSIITFGGQKIADGLV